MAWKTLEVTVHRAVFIQAAEVFQRLNQLFTHEKQPI